MKLILIGGLRRHGGKLLARLFDGHPNCYTLPLECRFAKPVKKPGTYKPPKNSWPDLNNVIDSRDVERLIRILNLAQIKKLSHIKKFRYDTIDLRFNEVAMQNHFRARLDETPQWTRQNIWDAEVEAYFQSLGGGVHWTGPRSHVVNHCATSIFLPLERFFDEFPESRFVYVFRSPQAYYASIKGRAINGKTGKMRQKWMIRGEDDYVALDLWLVRWMAGTSAALQARMKFGERMVLLRFEDLLRVPQTVMRTVAKEVGLDFNTILTKPCVLGQEWSGNSSFGSLEGLSITPLDQWRSKLTRGEHERIAEQTRDLLDTLGYGGKGTAADFDHPGNIDWSGIANHYGATAGTDAVKAADRYSGANLSVLSRVLGAIRLRTSALSPTRRSNQSP